MVRDLTPLEDARARVLARVGPPTSETVALDAALGRVLADPVTAAVAVPGFDNSAMDGFALRSADARAGARLRLVGESRAGAPWDGRLAAGEALAISTGAAIPDGADAVIPVEDTRRDGARVELATAAGAGANIRRAGEDIKQGARVIEAGVRLAPAELGVLAELGCAAVAVNRRPSVAVVTTGDELVPVSARLGYGEVHNSGAVVMPALVERAGAITASLAHAPDAPEAVRDALRSGMDADVLLVCGGMSVGEHDHVAAALRALGAELQFAGVALKPGRPTLFATSADTLIFGLPGNPVSSLVTFLLFVRPALLLLAGERAAARRTTAKLAGPVPQERRRVQAARCTLELRRDGWWATTTGPQGSHVLTSMLGAEAFAMIPAGEGVLAAGSEVALELL
jgi:molybdopterin molybdotransferase